MRSSCVSWWFAGFLKEGCELINEALNLFNNVYGAMHVEICACLRLLARLNYIMGDHAEVGLARLSTKEIRSRFNSLKDFQTNRLDDHQ